LTPDWVVAEVQELSHLQHRVSSSIRALTWFL